MVCITAVQAETVYRDGMMTVDQLSACAETVTWQITAADPSYFRNMAPMIGAMLRQPAATATASCPQMTTITVIGVVNNEPVYAGRLERATDWMRLQSTDLAAAGDIALAADAADPGRAARGLLPIDEIEPLSPYGIERGMTVAAADEQLVAKGFIRPNEISCEWKAGHADAGAELRVTLQTDAKGSRQTNRCEAGDRIGTVSLMQYDKRPDAVAKLPSPAEFAELWIARFGAPYDQRRCQDTDRGGPNRRADCRFRNIAAAYVGQLRLDYLSERMKPNVRLTIGITAPENIPAPKTGSDPLMDELRGRFPVKAPAEGNP